MGIYAIYSINNKIPTIALANDVIKDVIYYAQPTEVTIKNIIEEVSKSFGVTAEDIKSNKKKAEIVNARQFAMYIMREVTNLTLDEIGNQFGNKKPSIEGFFICHNYYLYRIKFTIWNYHFIR